jgi:hypothetical protein
MTPFQTYIAKSRYARFLDDKGRREHWDETVERYFSFMQKHLNDKHGYQLPASVRNKLQMAVENSEVMPSMRAIMTAGEALERQNVASYNCSMITLDDIKSFDEAMYVLLCGVGVGFSVETKYIKHLPEVPDKLFDSNTSVFVKDSKEGWAKALRQIITLLYAGEIPKWDVSHVRPAGARLKTFGGRASGPEPLVDLFRYVIAKFKGAVGRKLTSLECHDIMCKIGEVVVVGGVRRSAMISLSDLTDDRMAHAKAGNWWEGNGQRALANNSAVYDVKPSVGQFMREWSSIYESHSGERGIFNRYASENQAVKYGRRKHHKDFGTNPCCFTGDMRLLTDEGYVELSELAKRETVNIINYKGKTTVGKVWSSGVKKICSVEINQGYRQRPIKIFCTPDHRFMLSNGQEEEAQYLNGKEVQMELSGYTGKVVAVTMDLGEEEVFDFTEPDTHWGVVEGVVVHNSEIILRPYQFCNLSSVIVRADDDEDTLHEKMAMASMLGTFQSTLTHFPYLRKIWQSNTEEERLLGVSMTGILDNALLNNPDNESLPILLNSLRETVVATNVDLAAAIGINASVATTAIKPEGTVSQLTGTASGIHPQHSQYYIRRVRGDNKDPLTKFLKDSGFPAEPCVMKPDTTTVFSFPVAVKEGALLRDDLDAIKHLRLWLLYQQHYTEHKPSVTISVKEHEWPDVGAWVWNNFDQITGVSFLPQDGGTYRQSPYEEITKAEYEEMLKITPATINWEAFIENTDNVEGVQTLSCAAGGCEI